MPPNSDAYDRELERITRENAEFTARVMAEMERDRALMDAWLKENAADIDALLDELGYDDTLLDDLLKQSDTSRQTLTEAAAEGTSDSPN